MPTTTATPTTLQATLDAANPGDVLVLRSGDYPGEFTVRRPGLTLLPAPGETPVFVGPAKPDGGTKPTWLHIYPSAADAILHGLTFARDGDIASAKAFNDFGIIVEAPGVTITDCRLMGMVKGIHVKGRASTGVTIAQNHIGPTYQSSIVVGTSYGVVRGLLIAWNTLELSYREDGIQFMQDYDAANPAIDVSSLGTIIYQNTITDCNENAIDLKGAGLVVIHGNTITRTGGSNDGLLNGPNHNSNATIMHGKNATSGRILIRNNDLQNNCSGLRVYPGGVVVHNLIANNNYALDGAAWSGYGISQTNGAAGSAVKNNLVYGHKSADLTLTDSLHNRCNTATPGPGVALTFVSGSGSGDVLPVIDAGYFTDWFGRKDLPADVIWLGGAQYEVLGVDYAANKLHLDRVATWTDTQPVTWRSATPQVGPLAGGVVVVDPPVDPPADVEETVIVIIESQNLTRSRAEALRVLLGGDLTVRVEPRGSV